MPTMIRAYVFGESTFGRNTSENFAMPTNAYPVKATTLTSAKITTLIRDASAPLSLPKRSVIHSAPVVAFDRRSQEDKYTMRNIWLNTGHNQGMNTLLSP